MSIPHFNSLKRMIRECLGHFADESLPARSPARLSVLEPRILYSASPIDAGVDGATVVDIAHDSHFADQFEPYSDVFLTAFDAQLLEPLTGPITALPTEQHEPLVRELVLVNDNIENLDQLIEDLLASFKGRQFELVTISQSSDGIVQVNEILQRYSSLDSIHVFSHGSAGQINLGNAWLDAADFSSRLDDLSAWGNALTADGDLLFYGCDLAGDESGQDLLRLLADVTRADVAASDDLTGNSLLSGNWNLEFVVGDVMNASWLSVHQDWHWAGVLAGNVVVVDTTNDVNDGNTTSIAALLGSRGADGKISLREAILAANSSPNVGGPDEIRFAIPDNDPGHYYYRNNGTAVTFSAAVTTTLSDASITDFDTDYPYTAHSWFRINLNNVLPQLLVSDTVIIDGYSQPGASVNTLTIGQNANIRIELTNTASDGNRGLTFDTGSNGSILKGLAINRFGGLGVLIDYNVHGVTVQGNFIGTDITGTVDLGNGDSGIQVRSNNNQIGGPDLADRNLVSGNASRGVVLFNTSLLTGNVIQNNYIGTDSIGLKAIANDTAGIQLYNSDGTLVVDNVISGNGDGIWFRSGAGVQNINNVVTGNRIGLGADGTTIVANSGDGILVESGSANTIGGTTAATANYISGNIDNGISLSGAGSFGNVIIGNYVGLNTALGAAGNLQAGISVDLFSANNWIGGTTAGAGNRIANNGGDGVRILTAAGNGNAILGNSIFTNGEMGIDLRANGVLANDPGDLDIGPNGLQNYPVIGSAVTNGTSLTVSGSFNSLPLSTYRLEFFVSSTGDPSGNGEGEKYLGFVDVTTNASGVAAFSNIFAAVVPAGYSISATATDSAQNTSEFSANFIATSPTSNLPPTDLGPNSFAIVENTNTTGGFSLGVLTVTDPDVSDTFTFQVMPGSDGPKFSIGGAGSNELIITDGMIDYERQSIYSVNIRVTDSSGNTYDETLTVSVTNVDENPVANAGGPYVINEGSGVTLNGLGSTDPEGGPLTYRWDLDNDGIFGDVIGSNPPVPWATLVSRGLTNQGTFTIGLETTDAGGNRNTTTTTLTVNNLAPSANSDSGVGFTTNEDTPFLTGNVLANDSDPNSNDTLSVAGINTSLTRGLVTNNGDGTFTYNPNGQFDNLKPGDIATDTFVYTLRDEFGATSFATMIVTINGVNDLPVAVNDVFSATFGSTLVVSGPGLLANDFDVYSTVLTVTIVSGPVGGTLTSSPNGSFTYTPNGGFVGNDSFTYRANDGDGNSNLATVSILVAGVSPTGGGGGSGGTSSDNKDDNKNLPDTVIPGSLPESHGLSNRIPNKADQQPSAGARPAAQNAIRMESIRTRPDLEWTQDNGQDSYWYRYWAGMKKSAELQTGDFGMLRSLDFISQNGTFWQSLDGFLDNAVSNASLPIFVTGGSVAFTTSITAGYLVWLIRGGQILTALMANIPAWRLIDPLPILGRLPVEDDEDDDSLATMLAESSEDDYTKTFDWSDVAEAEQATSPGT